MKYFMYFSFSLRHSEKPDIGLFNASNLQQL